MRSKMKVLVMIMVIAVFWLSAVTGCVNDAEQISTTDSASNGQSTISEMDEKSENTTLSNTADVPVLNMAWDFDLHGSIMLAAAVKGDEFKNSGYYFNELINKEQYELYEGDTLIAIVNTIVTKGSSETAVMMGQGQIDMCVNSSTGMMAGIDQGTNVQMLCPIHVDGISLVFPKGTGISGWQEVEAYIKDSEIPVKIGFHSPTSAPRVLVQKALTDAGLKVSVDPDAQDVDVILVNLNGSKNLMPAFTSSVVDAWVAPSHYPELAESEGIGEIALKLTDFPPEGQWLDFPCCVFAAREAIVEKHPDIMKAMVGLLTASAEWCEHNRDEAAPVLGEIIGISPEVVKQAQIKFTTTPTKNWMAGEALYLTMLNELEIFEGDLKGKTLNDVQDQIFNFSFLAEKPELED